MIEVSGKEALVEVKGHEKNIIKRDISQLISDLGQLGMSVKRPELVTGILIGNAWRHSLLKDRDTKHQPLLAIIYRDSSTIC